jgi:hypothetical protein
MSNILGRIQVLSAMSVAANMAKKIYMGLWRLFSILIINKIREFPITAMTYMTQNGIPIQCCMDSRPGIPTSVSTEGMKTEPLAASMVNLSEPSSDIVSASTPWENLIA